MEYTELVEELVTSLLEEPSVGAATYWADRKARLARKAAIATSYKNKMDTDPEYRQEQEKRTAAFTARRESERRNAVVDTSRDW